MRELCGFTEAFKKLAHKHKYLLSQTLTLNCYTFCMSETLHFLYM